MDGIRKIIHIDMDAFYASIEQRDNPSLKGKPVIVGGDPNRRGVVATCSYEARKYGIHSAMSSMEAYKRCPQAIFVRGRMDVYKKVSTTIMDILHNYSDKVEPLALDEAFIDVTENKYNINSATIIAKEIRRTIYNETRLTASAGISYNKFLAKIASDYNKPNGMKVITPDEAEVFIESLPIGKFFGVGSVTKNKLNNIGVFNGRDLKRFSEQELINLFGKQGTLLYSFARGIDNRKVKHEIGRKSIGRETTLSDDTDDIEEILIILKKLSSLVVNRLKENLKANTVTLKIKFNDFQTITRRITVNKGISTYDDIIINLEKLLKNISFNGRKVRLLGVTLSNFDDEIVYSNINEDQIKFEI